MDTPQDRIRRIKARIAHRRHHERRKREARLIRKCLKAAMGGRCVLCGCSVGLEFDHFPKPRTWVPSKLNCFQRAKQYLKDWAAGKLRLLCCRCNKSDGGFKRWHKVHHENEDTQESIESKIARCGRSFHPKESPLQNVRDAVLASYNKEYADYMSRAGAVPLKAS